LSGFDLIHKSKVITDVLLKGTFYFVLSISALDFQFGTIYDDIVIRYRNTIKHESLEKGVVMVDEILKDFFLGFIKIHILHHAAREPIYVSEFREELARHGYEFSFGTLYPIFHKLHQEDYLKLDERVVSGKLRKYYLITPKGEQVLEMAKIKAKELLVEILGNE
jgi:DNA-binding PadR family transcriptional regulator